MDIRCSVRPSGAASLLERSRNSNAVSIGFWFSMGSGLESPEERGFTHFVEHMLFKGTSTRNALALAREAERAGGYLNAFTERNSVCIHCTLPAANWPIALGLLSDMAFNSIFTQEEFEREKSVVYSEVLAVKDDPEEDSADEFQIRILNGHPMALRIAGEPEDVEGIDRDRLYRFYREYFTPTNLTIAAAGDFNPDEFEGRIDAVLGGIPGGPRTHDTGVPVYRPGMWALPASVGQVYLMAGTVFPKSLSRDELFSADALNCAFGESSSSRLFQNIRETQGLCYSIGSSFSSTESFGAFFVTAVSSASDFPRLWDMIRKELDALKREGLSSEEISDAVAHIYGQDVVAADDMETRMRSLARQWMRYGEAEPYMMMAGRIHSVDSTGVEGVKNCIFDSPISVLAYGRIGAGVRKSLGLIGEGKGVHA